MARGTHLGASHELEVRWAELVNRLVLRPSWRATMSGTEATHLAMRGAGYTGHESGEAGGSLPQAGTTARWPASSPYDVPMSAASPASPWSRRLICPANDVKAVEITLQRGDVAAVILEPAGGQSGTTPTIPGYLQELRAITARLGVVLIFDEVITGFRYAPAGPRSTTASRPISPRWPRSWPGLPAAPSAASARSCR